MRKCLFIIMGLSLMLVTLGAAQAQTDSGTEAPAAGVTGAGVARHRSGRGERRRTERVAFPVAR